MWGRSWCRHGSDLDSQSLSCFSGPQTVPATAAALLGPCRESAALSPWELPGSPDTWRGRSQLEALTLQRSPSKRHSSATQSCVPAGAAAALCCLHLELADPRFLHPQSAPKGLILLAQSLCPAWGSLPGADTLQAPAGSAEPSWNLLTSPGT